MAKIMRQFTSLLKAGLNSLLEPAEDPRQTYSDPRERQQEMLERVRQALLQNGALRKRLDRRIVLLQTRLPQLEQAARLAVADGRDDLARLALQQRQLALLELKSLEANAREVQLEEQRVALVEQRLAAQAESMRIRQEMSEARYTAAESQVIVHEVLSGFTKELADLGQTLEQTEQKTEHMQMRANAIEEFANLASLDLANGSTSDPVAQELAQLDIDRAVEEQLAALKSA